METTKIFGGMVRVPRLINFTLLSLTVVGIESMLWAGRSGVRVLVRETNFFQASRPAVWPTQRPVRWVTEFLSGSKAAWT
jgi:hypothetical protein